LPRQSQPATVIPPWKIPKLAAITSAVFASCERVEVPMASETAKQSIASPIPTRRLVRRSMECYYEQGREPL